jgi:hypothetical protein
MNFQELLQHLRFEYWAEIHAHCQDDSAPSLIDQEKLEANPRLKTFYNYLLARGFSRQKLSANGIGRDIG